MKLVEELNRARHLAGMAPLSEEQKAKLVFEGWKAYPDHLYLDDDGNGDQAKITKKGDKYRVKGYGHGASGDDSGWITLDELMTQLRGYDAPPPSRDKLEKLKGK